MSDLLGSLIRTRETIFGAAFAVFVSPHSILVLLFGVAGSIGSGIFTGLFLSLTTALVWILTFRYDFAVSASDYIFGGLVVAVVSSVLSNGVTAEPKEYALLILTLSAYPACRLIRGTDLTRGRDTFICLQSVLALIGAAVTLAALIDQSSGLLPKPTILGFGGAAIQFLQSLSYLIFAVLMMWHLTVFRTFMFAVLLIIPIAIYAASLVRFTFVALVGALVLAAYLTAPRRRKNILVVVATIVFGVAAGFASRSAHVVQFAVYAVGGDQTVSPEVWAERAQGTRLPTNSGGAPKQETNSADKAQTNIAEVPEQRTNQAAKSQADPAEALEQRTSKAAKSLLAPSCSTDANVNQHNSIAIRKVLLHDAAFMLPSTGLFGHGLDSFMKETCLAGHQVHNSVLQAFVEFGWLGGVLFLTLIASSLWLIVRTTKHHAANRFVFCCLTFVALLCVVHGRFSRDAVLFAWIGAVAGITQPARTRSSVAPPAELPRCP